MGHRNPGETAEAMLMVRTGALIAASLELGVGGSRVGVRLWNALAERGIEGVTG